MLVYHQTVAGPPPFAFSCACGWCVLGASHAEHIADVYEAAARAGGTDPIR